MVRDLPERDEPRGDGALHGRRVLPRSPDPTNELLVLLGNDLYAERSATQTLDIIERRRDVLREKIQGTRARGWTP